MINNVNPLTNENATIVNSNASSHPTINSDGHQSQPSQAALAISNKVKDLCKNIIDNVRTATNEHLSHALQSIHASENIKMNHMRHHHDQKLSICRVSHRLERDHDCLKSKFCKLDMTEKMEERYKAQAHQMDAELERCRTMRKVQDKTLQECQQTLSRTANTLNETRNEYRRFKESSNERILKIEEMLNVKRKHQVWAHFKIVGFKKKANKAEHALELKKRDCKKKQEELKELQGRLRTSIDIREGLQRAFEKRATIRGRLYILNESNKNNKRRPVTRNCQRSRTSCAIASTQATLHHGKEMVHAYVNSSPFYNDEINALRRMKEDSDHVYEMANEKLEHVTKQNEAYRRLISGKGIALILASKHRELSENPTSMDAEMLYNLTVPSSVLTNESSQEKDCIVQRPKSSTSKRKLGARIPIPVVSEMSCLGGITGNQIKLSWMQQAQLSPQQVLKSTK